MKIPSLADELLPLTLVTVTLLSVPMLLQAGKKKGGGNGKEVLR